MRFVSGQSCDGFSLEFNLKFLFASANDKPDRDLELCVATRMHARYEDA